VLAGWGALGPLGLPLATAVNPLSAALAYYVPVGWLAAAVAAAAERPLRTIPLAATAAVLAGCLWSADRAATLNVRLAETDVVTSADRAALAWIRENLPADARLAGNATPWAYGLARGTDGGAWVWAHGARQSLVAPLSYSYGPRDSAAATSAEMIRLADIADTPSKLVGELRDAGWTHLYLGRRGGPIDPLLVRADPRVSAVYEADGVTILALRPLP
jgi:hypothetical protein